MSQPVELPRWMDVALLPLVNLAMALVVCAIVVAVVGLDPLHVITLLAKGAFGSKAGISYTLYYATTFVFTGLAVAVAFLSASQDVVIDAYRTDLLPAAERGLGSSVAVLGYRLAMILSGGVALIWVDPSNASGPGGWTWPEVYRFMAALMAGAAALSALVLPRGNSWTCEASHEFSNVDGPHNLELWFKARAAGAASNAGSFLVKISAGEAL